MPTKAWSSSSNGTLRLTNNPLDNLWPLSACTLPLLVVEIRNFVLEITVGWKTFILSCPLSFMLFSSIPCSPEIPFLSSDILQSPTQVQQSLVVKLNPTQSIPLTSGSVTHLVPSTWRNWVFYKSNMNRFCSNSHKIKWHYACPPTHSTCFLLINKVSRRWLSPSFLHKLPFFPFLDCVWHFTS